MIIAVLFVTVLIDVRFHKIPNIILIFLLLIQILSRIIDSTDGFPIDPGILIPHYLTVIIVFFILYFFFSIGTLGAGDIKLIGVTALSVYDPLKYILLIFVTGSVIAVFRMLTSRELCRRLKILVAYLRKCVRMGRAIPYTEAKIEPVDKVKYSVHLSIPVFAAYTIISLLGRAG